MSIRVGLMGFGRIGRNVFRILHDRRDIDVVAICEIVPDEAIEYLLRWDTVHGPFQDKVAIDGDTLYAGGKSVKLIQAKAPGDVRWSDHQVDVVVEATAKYRTKAELEKHLQTGAKRVILTVPPQNNDEDIDIVVMGVNDEIVTADKPIWSNGSATVNCVAPVLKILNDAFGIKRASMTSVHAYTNAQRLADVPHSDFRVSRSAVENIIPTQTSSPVFIGRVLPELEGKLGGIAMNVPVPDGSIVDLVTELNKNVTVEEVNNIMATAADSRAYRNIVQYETDPIVSSDVIGNTHSAIFDSRATKVLAGNLLKTLTWYDNGWGYACRVVELIERLATLEEGGN